MEGQIAYAVKLNKEVNKKIYSFLRIILTDGVQIDELLVELIPEFYDAGATVVIIVGPSTILLQPHVGRFHASDQEKISIFCQLSGK